MLTLTAVCPQQSLSCLCCWWTAQHIVCFAAQGECSSSSLDQLWQELIQGSRHFCDRGPPLPWHTCFAPQCAPTARLPPAEKEHDATLNAILDRVVGLGWEKGWTPKLSQRCVCARLNVGKSERECWQRLPFLLLLLLPSALDSRVSQPASALLPPSLPGHLGAWLSYSPVRLSGGLLSCCPIADLIACHQVAQAGQPAWSRPGQSVRGRGGGCGDGSCQLRCVGGG